MSAIKKITIFPEGRAAETVIAVDLDNETTDYLSTYPGTAQRLGRYATEKLASDIRKAGRDENEVPGLTSALKNRSVEGEGLLLPYSRVWSLMAGTVAFCLGHVLLGISDIDVDGLPHFLFAFAAGFATMGYVSSKFQENKIEQRTRDEESKRIYAERLRESADHLIRIDDKAANSVRSAINCVNTIHGHLAQLRRLGLSTVEETTAADDALDAVIQGHMDERASKTRSKRYQRVLQEVDNETVKADEDLQHVQQLNEEQGQIQQEAKDRIGNAMSELNTLMGASAKFVQHASAKLSAAELRNEE